MRVVGHFNQFRVYSHSVPVSLHASFYDVLNTELLCDLTQVSARALVILRRSAGNHLEIADLGKPGEDFPLYPIGEICVLRVGTEILKRQHGEHDLFRSRWRYVPKVSPRHVTDDDQNGRGRTNDGGFSPMFWCAWFPFT
jgi:hypothetical protein